jgi:hypothetical protein
MTILESSLKSVFLGLTQVELMDQLVTGFARFRGWRFSHSLERGLAGQCNPLDDLQPIAFELREPHGVVAEETDGRHAEIREDLSPDVVGSRVAGR